MHEFEYETEIMGCEAAITLIAPNATVADAAYARMLRVAETDTKRFSRFMNESELSRVNASGGGVLSPDFHEALVLSRELYRRTDGALNPLADISRFGYDADIAFVRGQERSRVSGAYDTDLSSVLEHQGVLTLTEGQRLDFNAFQKGRTAETMARKAELPGVIVNLGGDIFTLGYDANHAPFEFSIEHPEDPYAILRFSARACGIATSGPSRRAWSLDGEPFHHVLDKTGRRNPRTDLVSATVIAPSGHEADAFATAALILGSKRAAGLLAQEGFPYCFITDAGTVHTSPDFGLIRESAISYA